jgi:hypothetical protein
MPSVLFLLLVIQLIGFTAYFEVSHYLIRKEVKSIIKQGVPEENRVIFTFTSTQLNALQWVKDNEFRIGKTMYDVVETKTLANGSTELQCISDIQEERLFASLSFSVGRNMGDDHQSTPYTTLFKIIQTPALLNEPSKIVESIFVVLNSRHFFAYSAPVSEEFKCSVEQPPCMFC